MGSDLARSSSRASLAGKRANGIVLCLLVADVIDFFPSSASLASMGTLHDAPLVKPFPPGASLSFPSVSRRTQFFDRFRPRSGGDDHRAPRRKVVSARLRERKISMPLLPFPFSTSSFLHQPSLRCREASSAECKCLPTP